MQCDLKGRKRTKNNKDTAVEKHGTGCDKNYFNASNERTMISGEWAILVVSEERQARARMK